MIVMKFGGSSLKDAKQLQLVSELIKTFIKQQPIVVLSAMGDTTDLLLKAGQLDLEGEVDIQDIVAIHKNAAEALELPFDSFESEFKQLSDLLQGIRLIQEFTVKTRDHLLSFGERLSVLILTAYLNRIGIAAKGFDAWSLGIFTDSGHTEAKILKESEKNIADHLYALKSDYSYTPIVTGFIAKNKQGEITTLGRGGSDLTASTIGAALKVEEIQVWKDVDGILTTDPRMVEDAQPVPIVSFEEASELAYFGAKILHPRAILPAMEKNIPVRVKNTYNPEHPGTVIVKELKEKTALITAITHKNPVTLVDIVSTRMLGQHGFLATVFNIFNDLKISVDVIATSEVSVSLTLDHAEHVTKLKQELEKFSHVNIHENKAIISLIGDVSRSTKSLQMAFTLFDQKNINVEMVSHGASKVNISFIVQEDDLKQSLSQLHQLFFKR